MKVGKSIAAFLVLFYLSGCTLFTRNQWVKAMEGVGPNVPPYDSLGTLEVKEFAPWLTVPAVLWTGVEVATLSFAKTPSRGDHYKRALRSELAYVASHQYGADAVINVTYWPDPDSKSFADGRIYCRGEMIRYKRFPQPEASENPQPEMQTETPVSVPAVAAPPTAPAPPVEGAPAPVSVNQ